MNKYHRLFTLLFIVVACGNPSSNTPPVVNYYPIGRDSAWAGANPLLIEHGVHYYDSTKTDNGATLLDEQTRSTLIDMHGNVLAKLPFGLTCPLPDGTLLGAMAPEVMKFDQDLSLIWKITAFPHHEITADENGFVYLLSSDGHKFMGLNVNFDVVRIYSPDGEMIYEWHVFDHLAEVILVISKSAYLKGLSYPYNPDEGVEKYISQNAERLFWHNNPVTKDTSFEFTHFNSIQVLPENEVYQKIPAFKKGNLLMSFNPYACYGILDTATGKIEWAGYLPERTTLHTPLLTPAGTILVFQNSTQSSLWSDKKNDPCLQHLHRIIPPQDPSPEPEPRNWVSITEYDPVTNAIIWEFTATPKEWLQADMLGSAQRLPNGNTLVCAASGNRGCQVFEVTPEKEIVWNYVSPENNPDGNRPTCFYRAKRISFDIAKKISAGL